jgi:hypothetical protein
MIPDRSRKKPALPDWPNPRTMASDLVGRFQDKQRDQDSRLSLKHNLLDIESRGSVRVLAGAQYAR